MQKNYIFHVISNTHWDREWRFSFQRNRQLLVEMMDELLLVLEKYPAYRAFHLDSQTIVLEDYLEIRPQKRDAVQKLVREGRLLIGPWFILPDEFQVGGESLIRNLLLGHRIAREFGHVMKVGYSPFSWGQISQLPQIYESFGIDVIMFYRGINSLDSPKSEFLWEGADGTTVLSSRFSTMPRYNFYFYIYRPVVHNEQIGDVEYKWARGGVPFHFADREQKDEDYNLLQPGDAYYPENLEPAIRAIIDRQINDFTTPHIFWAEGHDSSGPNARTVRIIEDAQAIIQNGTVIHSTLEEYAEGLKSSVDRSALKRVKGERRSAQFDHNSGNLYGFTTSARMYLKQENFDVERWLQFYAEPFNGIASWLGLDTEDRYLEKAWHLLLQNSAHDSIGGCSLDAIHEDMMNRYKQAREIAQGLFSRACRHIARQIDLSSYPENSIHMVAVNPCTFARRAVVEAFIDIPAEQDRGGILVKDHNGRNIPVQLVDISDTQPVLEQMTDRPMYFKMKRYHCYLYLENLPALGFTSFHISPADSTSEPRSVLVRMEKDVPVLENKFLKVSVNKNGTVNVYHKLTGDAYRDLACFQDTGEAGHAWVHEPEGEPLTTRQSKASLGVLQNGPLKGTVRVKHLLPVPASLEDRRNNRQMVDLPITLDISLRRDSKIVEFDVHVDNRAESHRLRMLFPTDIDAENSYGEGQFDVVARPSFRPDTGDWLEQPMYDYPMHQFVDISDGKRGAAFFVDGLKEYEFMDDDRHTLAITLLRGFRYIIQPSSVQDISHMKGSQCPGEQRCRLAFHPHRGDWVEGNVYPQALAFNNAVRLFQTGRSTGSLNRHTSFLQIHPENLIFSTLKAPEDGTEGCVVLRVYNPTDKVIRGSIKSLFTLLKADRLTLEEKSIDELPLKEAKILEIEVPAKKIVTIKFLIGRYSH